jgi:hydrogenase nickel incorporation protein HypB
MQVPVISSRYHEPNPIAGLNRDALREAGVLAVGVFGGPGCGKTSLISATIARLTPGVHVGVIACDAGTHRDADRIAREGRQVVQVNTGLGANVVEASHVQDALRCLDLGSLDLLLIENVGTLALPGIPDVGQDASVTVFSVAAGDDKADKHPELVSGADLVILNKTDLLASVPFDIGAFRADVGRIKPGIELIELSAIRGDGLAKWVAWLRGQVVVDETEKASHWFG